jgi:hypothetical protein
LEVSDDLAEHIGLAFVFPTVKDIVFNAKRKQNMLSLAVFSIPCAFDLA